MLLCRCSPPRFRSFSKIPLSWRPRGSPAGTWPGPARSAVGAGCPRPGLGCTPVRSRFWLIRLGTPGWSSQQRGVWSPTRKPPPTGCKGEPAQMGQWFYLCVHVCVRVCVRVFVCPLGGPQAESQERLNWRGSREGAEVRWEYPVQQETRWSLNSPGQSRHAAAESSPRFWPTAGPCLCGRGFVMEK